MKRIPWPGVIFVLMMILAALLPLWTECQSRARGREEGPTKRTSKAVLEQKSSFYCPACGADISLVSWTPFEKYSSTAAIPIKLSKAPLGASLALKKTEGSTYPRIRPTDDE